MFKSNFVVKLKLKSPSFFMRDKTIILEFEEANVEETLEFMEKSLKADFALIEYLYNFFEKTSKGEISKKLFVKYMANNLVYVIGILKKTYLVGVYWGENQEKKDISTEEPEEMDMEAFKRDFARLVAFLSKPMATGPNEILKTYTWGQINFWTKHYLYNERQKTEEGQKENKKIENKEYTDKYEKEIKETLGRLDRYLKK